MREFQLLLLELSHKWCLARQLHCGVARPLVEGAGGQRQQLAQDRQGRPRLLKISQFSKVACSTRITGCSSQCCKFTSFPFVCFFEVVGGSVLLSLPSIVGASHGALIIHHLILSGSTYCQDAHCLLRSLTCTGSNPTRCT